MQKRYEGKRVVITGAGSGIGKAMALRFADEGAEVVVVELFPELAQATVQEIEAKGGRARAETADVGDTASVHAAFDRIDSLDVLVNNAGISSVGTVETTTPEEMDRIYRVNVKGMYHCLHFGVKKMLAGEKGGVILNMASIASKAALADRFAYSMSKGAVLTMTFSVAKDYVHRGIRCNCICPARVHTPFVDGYLDKHYPDNREEMFQKLSEYQPIGRMGKPEEIAGLATYLCSEEASFVTGAAYDIDGGTLNLR